MPVRLHIPVGDFRWISLCEGEDSEPPLIKSDRANLFAQETASPSAPQPILTEMAQKLDRMMCVLFEYLNVSLAPHEDDASPLERAQLNAELFSLLMVSIACCLLMPCYWMR